jgi:hypothetical protein
MRKDGQPHVFKRVKLKDLYGQIKNGEMTERSFKEWLQFYRYKHWGMGMDDHAALLTTNQDRGRIKL